MNTDEQLHVFRIFPEKYGEGYNDALLEQYKLFVHSSEEVTQRRAKTNNYLLSVNIFIVSLHAVLQQFPPFGEKVYIIALAGIMICVAWLSLIINYRDRNKTKYEIIHTLEQKLPTAPFETEWRGMSNKTSWFRITTTTIEQAIPVIFCMMYISLILTSIL